MSNGDREYELTGLRVVELGESLAGRLTARHLSDQGAELVCVDSIGKVTAQERLEDPVMRGTVRVVDLSSPAGHEQLRELVANADVLIEGFGEETLSTLGLERETFIRWQPELIYCALRTYPCGMAKQGLAPLEWLAASELGFHRSARDGELRIEELAIASSYAALQASLYIAASLYGDDGLRGSVQEISLIGAGLLALSGRLLSMGDPRYRPAAETFHLPIAQRFICADGRYIQCEGTVPGVAAAVCKSLGHPEWIDDAIAGLSGLKDVEELHLWEKRFADIFSTLPASEWEERIAEGGGAASVCRTRREWLVDEHARKSGIIVETRDEQGESEFEVGPAVRIYSNRPPASDDSFPEPSRNVDPRVGDDKRLPLDGVRVIDTCVILAGPTCGRLLAELGAEVIKVDAPFWASRPYIRTFGWIDLNRNKRSIIVDLRTEGGREVFWKLIESADVVMENYRLGKMERLGFGFDSASSRKSAIVYTSLNAFDVGGPYSERPGWDPNAQAMTGMELSRGNGVVPRQAPMPLNDYATGLIGAFGTVLGLRGSRRTGRAVHVQASLARTASLIQLSELSGPPVDRSAASDRPIWLNASPEFLRCRDGWVMTETLDLEGLEIFERTDGATVEYVTDLRCERALEMFNDGGVRAAIVRKPENLGDVEWIRDCGLIRDWDHPRWGQITQTFPQPVTNGVQGPIGRPSQDPGEASMEILGELGYTAEEIEELLSSRAICGHVPLFQGANAD